MKTLLTALTLGALSLFTFSVVAQSEKSTHTAEAKTFTPAGLTWAPAPFFLPKGASLAILEGDPTKKGDFTIRLHVPAGYKIPPHTHPNSEKITVITGACRFAMGGTFDESAGFELPAGGFARMPAGMKHFALAREESILQVHGKGPFAIKYVNAADDPRHH